MTKHRLRGRLAGLLTALTAVTVVLAGCGTDAGSGSSASSSPIEIWEGFTGTEATTFAHLVSEYQTEHPGVKVSSLYVNNDDTLQKVLTAVRGGSTPDIAYLYGSWAPNVAQIPQVVNLTQVVKRPGVNWDDFFTGERDVATVNGKVIGIPALVDNLAVVYNKKLFAAAGLPVPAAGLKSLETLRTMSVTDKSMYLDPTDSAYANLFNSGKIGMLVTGPWDLSGFPNVDYGVQVMPSYPGTDGGHQTISGPDNWVVFNNGSARVSAAEQFLLWLTAPAQVKYFSLKTGDLPTRSSVADQASVIKAMNTVLPGDAAFVQNLAEVKQARPQITQYPKISTILGTMIVSVLLGKSQPQAALDSAAQQVNAALAG